MGFEKVRSTGLALVVGAMLLALPGVGCARRALSPPPPDPVDTEREEYVIGVADVLQVHVWRNPELGIQAIVRPDGKISVPLLDDVQASGLTALELKAVITRELAEYITSPDVTVSIASMNSRTASIMGAVNRNGRVPLVREIRVLEAIAEHGGFNQFANKRDVRIVRRNPDGSESEFRFDYEAYVRGTAPGTNIVLQPGDTVIVPE